MKKRNMKKGFTLVELVIVIAVIAILAGVLIPTFGNVIEKANKSAALQEARNEYTAYLADYDYVTPPTEGQVKEGYVIVENGTKDYYFEIKAGVLTGKVEELEAAPTVEGKTWTQVSVVKDDKEDADASNDVKYNVWYAKAN